MNKRNFIVVILVFFLKIFTVKCDDENDDNYVFVNIYNYANLYMIEGNLEEKKVKIDDDFTNKEYDKFIEKISQKAFYEPYNQPRESFNKILKQNNPSKLQYIIVSNTVTNQDSFFEFYNDCYDYNYYLKRVYSLNDEITSKEFKIYKDFSEMIDDNNYKQKTINLIYSSADINYNEYKNDIEKLNFNGQIINLNNLLITDDSILSILKCRAGLNDIFNEKINENLKENIDNSININFSSDPAKPDNKKIEVFLKLGGFFECTNYDKASKTCTVSAKYKRKINLHFKVPDNYEIVDYFKDNTTFEIYLDNFKISELLSKLFSFIENYNQLKKYKLNQYNIKCYEIHSLFNTIEDSCDYEELGIFANYLKIKGKTKDNVDFEKIINSKTEYNNLQDSDIFESKNNEIIDIEIDLGIYSELLKTDYVRITFEAPDGYELCDRLNKNVCFPIPLQLYENNHNQCFFDSMRFLGIVSKNSDVIKLKFPKDFYELEPVYDSDKGKPIKIQDMGRFKVKLTSKTIGKYSKKSGSADPEPYDPDNDDEYKNDQRNYNDFKPNERESEQPEIPTEDCPKVEKSHIDKCACCGKCIVCCLCCNNNKKTK